MASTFLGAPHNDLIFRTINVNRGVTSYDTGRANAIKSLMLGTTIETLLQLYCFITNPALRLQKINLFRSNKFFKIVQSKKDNETF